MASKICKERDDAALVALAALGGRPPDSFRPFESDGSGFFGQPLLLQCFVIFLFHLFVSVILTAIILLVDADRFSSFAYEVMGIWPLLSRSQHYMDLTGRHDAFLYMSALYAKDIVLLIIFIIINVCLAVRNGYRINFRVERGTLRFIGAPFMFFGIIWLIYYGTPDIPDRGAHRNTIFEGGLIQGSLLMAFGCSFTLYLFFFWLVGRFLVPRDFKHDV